jgi:predicted house-cleaning noncanonical NTP pyrophosphatase (MazG superfamily)
MNETEVLQKLDAIREEAEQIGKIVGNGRVTQAQVPYSQELFRELKKKLETEYKRMSTVKGEANLSDVEAYFYKPAIDDAWANTTIGRVRWNSRPDSSWHEVLSSVSDYMNYWGDQLKRPKVKNIPN